LSALISAEVSSASRTNQGKLQVCNKPLHF
jgi:hypothetical protein